MFNDSRRLESITGFSDILLEDVSGVRGERVHVFGIFPFCTLFPTFLVLCTPLHFGSLLALRSERGVLRWEGSCRSEKGLILLCRLDHLVPLLLRELAFQGEFCTG